MKIPEVVSVSCATSHQFSKSQASAIRLLAGLGVENDAHQGVYVKHRSRVAVDPTQPNLRQVHLIHVELFDELQVKGFRVGPSDLGENITTSGIDLLRLPRGSLLYIGDTAVLEVTGLRNPCAQIETFMSGLLSAVIDIGPNGEVIRKAGIMAVVQTGGLIRPGDSITVDLPIPPHRPLERV